MKASLRSWWRNCALEADSEIMSIDRMEDHIAPVDPKTAQIRELISSLELCHHKAERWTWNIIKAIGAGETTKGLGTRLPGRLHPAEEVWLNACEALSQWSAGSPAAEVDLSVGTVPASKLLASLGERSPLKEWQVQRVIEKIQTMVHWPQPSDDPTARYVWILLSGDEYEVAYLDECPEQYKEHEDYWLKTVRTLIHDTVSGEEAKLSLGLAIDLLMPCHWGFVENLKIVLDAIGGRLNPDRPFAACGRNITLVPIRQSMETISNTLKVFCNDSESNQEFDKDLLALLGEATKPKRWLAASLDKTIRLQLSPSAELRAMSALAGPDWIRE